MGRPSTTECTYLHTFGGQYQPLAVCAPYHTGRGMGLQMLWLGRFTMLHPSCQTSAVMEDIPISQSLLAKDPSTDATVVVQPLAGDCSGFPWASTKMSSVEGS